MATQADGLGARVPPAAASIVTRDDVHGRSHRFTKDVSISCMTIRPAVMPTSNEKSKSTLTFLRLAVSFARTPATQSARRLFLASLLYLPLLCGLLIV